MHLTSPSPTIPGVPAMPCRFALHSQEILVVIHTDDTLCKMGLNSFSVTLNIILVSAQLTYR